jgi:two-component system, NarL family, nitrate/nitrite response regulator NarL
VNIVLLGPNGMLRDLVAAVLTVQGIKVEVASAERFEVPMIAAGSLPVLVLVEPGRQEWASAREYPGSVVLVSDRELNDDEAVEAVMEGADAVLHADVSPRELASAIASVCRGETVLSSSQVKRLVESARLSHGRQSQETLTPREIEILASVERGESVKQTARVLGITPKTVENLQSRLFRKLGAKNRAHAVVMAHRLGFLSNLSIAA